MTQLPDIIARHVNAVNAFDTDAIVATFSEDAFVNDVRREIVGIAAIRAWVAKELVGDKVTMDVRETIDHRGTTIVRAEYNGTFDRTNLPAELIISSYFNVRDGKIASLIIVLNQPSPY